MSDLHKQAMLLETLTKDPVGTIPPKELANFLLLLTERIEHNEKRVDKLISLTEKLVSLVEKE